MRPYLDDANPRIAATAAAVLAGSSKDEDRELAERTLSRLSGASSDRNAARREVAIALRQIASSDFGTAGLMARGDGTGSCGGGIAGLPVRMAYSVAPSA